jgi:hypothetical protein
MPLKNSAEMVVVVPFDEHFVKEARPDRANATGLSHSSIMPALPTLAPLRVAARARIVRDPVLQQRLAVNGKEPLLCLVNDVQEAFMHCGKSACAPASGNPKHGLTAAMCPR